MTFKRGIVALVLAAGLSLAASGVPQEAGRARAPNKNPQRLVRLDLLVPAERTLQPEHRNIFIAGSEASEEEAQPVPQTLNGRTRRPVPTPAEETEPGETAPGTQYIGYVLSPRGVIGLLLSEGTTQALAQGDSIRPGYKVTKLDRKEVEVTGPDGVKKTYLLQGVEK
jgi:hypothetical protein